MDSVNGRRVGASAIQVAQCEMTGTPNYSLILKVVCCESGDMVLSLYAGRLLFTIINMNLDLSKIINWNWVEVVLGMI